MDKLWLVQKRCLWFFDEQSGEDIVEEFVYNGSEESVKQLIMQYGEVEDYDQGYYSITRLIYKEYNYPKIWTIFPESFTI